MKNRISNLLLIFMLGFTFTMYAQQKTVSGVIADATDGNPLPGASVVVEGTTNGVISDIDGKYTITVNENDILLISFIGFDSQQISVTGKTIININLKGDDELLNEVVVVAYGTQKREAVTSSIATVKADKLVDQTESDVSSMLQGKVAGVQVSAKGGSPGEAPEILIRGMASLGGNVSPLWVVDGVVQHGTPVVNPNDIETVSVLKDASATSLYGSRGANGVIIIATKRAKTGASELTFSSKFGVNQFNRGNFEVMNSQQLYDYHETMGNTQDWFTPELLNRDYNWLENGTQSALVQDHNISYTSSTDKANTYLSGGFYSEEGTVKGTEFDRYTFRMNLDYKVNKRLTLKPKLSFSLDKGYSAEHGRYDMYNNLPWDLPFDEAGNVIKAQDSDVWLGRDQNNYYYDLQWNHNEDKTFNMSFNGDFEFELLNDLTYVSTNNFTLLHYNSMSYADPRSISGESTTGSLENYSHRRFTRLTTQMLRYKKEFDEHSLTALAGYEYNDYVYESYSALGTSMIEGGEILDVTSEAQKVMGTKNDYAMQSGFFNLDYSYGNRYFARASIRRDGASNFGVDNKYGTFYSFGAGWNIHSEEFFNVHYINILKLRASYGSVGNRPGSLYPYQGTYSAKVHYDGVPAAVLDQYENPDLGWEKSYETNIALDARFFNRVNATLEYYVKNTSDLLYYVDLPSITGFDGYWENVRGLKDTGYELVLSADVIRNIDFKWNLGFNIGVNKNEITELFDGQTEIDRKENKIFKVGEDMNTWYLKKWAGVHPGNGTPLWEVVDEETGEISYTGSYNAATKQIVGNATPDFIGGFSSNMEFKGFTLDAMFSFVSGGEIYNGSRQHFDSDGAYPTFNQQVFHDDWSRWEKPGDIATHPRAVYGGNNFSNEKSSRWLEDRSYLKLRSITLGYNVPKNILGKTPVKNAKVYFSGENLLTFTSYSGMDPEVGGIRGDTGHSYPVPKRFVFGLNLSF